MQTYSELNKIELTSVKFLLKSIEYFSEKNATITNEWSYTYLRL